MFSIGTQRCCSFVPVILLASMVVVTGGLTKR
jgi:hypothetical protein